MGVPVPRRRQSANATAQRAVAGAHVGGLRGVRSDGTQHLLSSLCCKWESQSAWEGLLEDLYRRRLKGENLLLIVTDGCPGLAAAIETVYPRTLHQRCRVQQMGNISEKVRRRDYDAVKAADAQAIYRAESRRQAEAVFRAFRRRS